MAKKISAAAKAELKAAIEAHSDTVKEFDKASIYLDNVDIYKNDKMLTRGINDVVKAYKSGLVAVAKCFKLIQALFPDVNDIGTLILLLKTFGTTGTFDLPTKETK